MTDNQRKFKQTLVATAYLLVLIVLIAVLTFVFFPAQQPSEPVDTPDTKALQIKNTHQIPVSNGRMDLAAKVENPNNAYGLRRLDYAFVFKNDDTTRNVEGTSYILPGETKFFTQLNVPVKNDLKFQEFRITSQSAWKKLTVDPPRLAIQNINAADTSEGEYKLSGEVVNRSPYDLRTVTATVILEGEDRVLGVNKTKLNIVQNQETRGFQVTWPSSVAASEVENTRIRPSANTLNPDEVLYISEEEVDQFR